MTQRDGTGPTTEQERAWARRFGFSSLLLWALLGTGLEAAHGLKLAAYLDDGLVRMLLRLAHAHGVGLSLLLLVFGEAGLPLYADCADAGRGARRMLQAGTLLLPLGFSLGTLGHGEVDPGVGVLLAPVGGLCVLWVLAATARRSFHGTGR